MGIADRVSLECNQAFIAHKISEKPDDVQKMAGIVFMQKMKSLDMKLMKTCDIALITDGLEKIVLQGCASRRQKIQELSLYKRGVPIA